MKIVSWTGKDMRVMCKLIGTCYTPKEQLRQSFGTAAVSLSIELTRANQR